MKNKILFLSLILFLCASCQKEEVLLGSLFGTVNDKASGKSLGNVEVMLIETGASITTGDDGLFEFHNLQAGRYSLQFTKTGYESIRKDNIEVNAGENNKPVFVQMEKLPPSFRIINESGEDLSQLNFGYERDDNMRSFTIFNDGADKFEWKAEKTAKWIKTISPDAGVLLSSKTQPVLVVIDRNELSEGENETTIQILPTEGNVSKQIKIVASAYHSPVINLYNPIEVSYQSVTLKCIITDPGMPEYRMFGFIVSKQMQPDLSNAVLKNSMTRQDVEKSNNQVDYKFEGLEPDKTYYARAYTISEIDTVYSNTISFVTREQKLPKLKNITKTGENGLSATFYSEIEDDGGTSITQKGVCWSTNQMPTVDDNKTMDGTGLSSFNSTVSGLEPNKTYYVRSYARNGDDYGYSDNQETVVTTNGLPKVRTISLANPTSQSVDVNYEITDNAGSTIMEHGVVYSTSPYPDINNGNKVDGTGTNPYIAHITNLQAGIKYYVRAYAKNSAAGPGYGEQLTFSTSDGLADVITGDNSVISSTSVVCSGSVSKDNGRAVTERGICYSLNANPTISDMKVKDIYDGLGSFSCTLTGLSIATEYHYRAYAINSAGPSYGTDKKFKTQADKPAVSTLAATNVAGASATLHGKITNDGGSKIINCGFVCSNGETIQYLQNLNGEFSATITGLLPNVNYTYYAFAENEEVGIGKGGTQSIKITAKAPGVSNRGASSITSTSATITGNITNDGGSEVEVCGVCYSASVTRPTPQNSTCTEITNVTMGMFSSTITGLSPKTKYYYNVYAKNAVDTSVGIPANFTTESGSGSSCSLSVKKSQSPTYNGNEATVYGKITSDCEITRWGIVVGVSNSSPSLDNYDAIQNNDGSPYSNDISVTITGIPSLTMIYYRFYVVNSQNKVAYSESDYLIVD